MEVSYPDNVNMEGVKREIGEKVGNVYVCFLEIDRNLHQLCFLEMDEETRIDLIKLKVRNY